MQILLTNHFPPTTNRLFCADGLIGKFLGPSSSAMIYYGDPSKTLGSWARKQLFDSWMSPPVASMMWGFAHALIWIPVAYIMYRLNIFIRV